MLGCCFSAQGDILDQIVTAFVALLVNIIERIISVLLQMVDAIAALVITIVTVAFVVPIAYGLAALCIPITVATIAIMLLVKSGWSHHVLPESITENPLLLAISLTLASAVGSFGFLFIVMQYPDIQSAFFKIYGVFPEAVPQAKYNSNLEEVYDKWLAKYVRYTKMWFYMTGRDGILFFVSTAGLLYWQQFTRSKKSVVLQLIGIPIGLCLFAFVIYGDELISSILRGDIPSFVKQLFVYIRDEVNSFVVLVRIPFSGGELTFSGWIHNELVKMGGSIYKMSSLYPKLLLVLLVTNIVALRNSYVSASA